MFSFRFSISFASRVFLPRWDPITHLPGDTHHVVEVEDIVVVDLFAHGLLLDDAETGGVLVIADAPRPEEILLPVNLLHASNTDTLQCKYKILFVLGFFCMFVCLFVCLTTYRDHFPFPLLR